MMVAIGVYMRRWQRLLRRWASEPKVHMLLQGAVYLAAGFLSSAASLAQHLQPIALGVLLSQTGWPAVLVALGAAAGYLLFWGSAGVQGMVWVAMGLGAALLIGGKQIQRQTPLLMPAIAALTVAASGLLMLYLELHTVPVPVFLLGIALAPLSTWVVSAAMERRDPVIDWLICGMAVLCTAQVVPLPYFGLGYVVAGALSMVGAFPAAALGGLALDLAQVTSTPMAAVLCITYLVRLIPRLKPAYRHFAPGLVYLLVMGICGTWDLTPLPGLVIGSFCAMPLPQKSALSQRRGETGMAQVQLELASAVLRQTETMLFDVDEVAVDEQALMERAAERACGSCPCRKGCKEDPSQMSPQILHRPLGNADLPGGCRKTGRLLMELRRSQEQLRAIRADRDRQQEYRAAVGQQYHFLSDYLQDIADRLVERANPPKPWFQPEVAACSASQNRTNGDRCLWFAGVECRYYVLICDGMGTGEAAARDAQSVSSMLRRLLCAGFPAAYALRSVNSLCALQGRAGAVTIDLAELRLDTGKATLYKWGAAPSYVISQGEPVRVGIATPPPGLSVTDGRETVERLSLRRGETLVLLSDGAGGEGSLRRGWWDENAAAGELAARILQDSPMGNSDDATVAVIRLHGTALST